MNILNMKNMVCALSMLATTFTFAVNAEASGYEKSVTWGAHSAGMGGIASPYITGADSLYFNPAGLAGEKPGHEVAFSISPVWSQFKGPINFQNEESTSKQSLSTPLGLIYNGKIDSQFGFGIGGYNSGGAVASYEDVNFPGTAARTANLKTDIKINEIALGAGYKVNDALKVGIAWRIVMASADFAFVQPVSNLTTAGFLNAEVNGIKTTNFTGFKLGAQYKLNEKTMLGLVYRSEVELKGDGTYGGRLSNVSPAVALPIDQTTATAKTVFPMQASLGVQHSYEKWRALAEYVWTQYSRVGAIVVEGPITRSGGSAVSPSGAKLETNWRDQHNLRLGGEYRGMSWPVRFGYVLTSTVTNTAFARANFTPPGPAHTLTAGTGQNWDLGGNPLMFNVAGEYTMASGDSEGGLSSGSTLDASGGYTRAGTFKVTAYALHLGVSYAF